MAEQTQGSPVPLNKASPRDQKLSLELYSWNLWGWQGAGKEQFL